MSTAALLQRLVATPRTPGHSRRTALLLQRKCPCGSPTASLTGECADCKSKKRLQTKLAIGASHDPLEQEADRVADQVLAAPENHGASGIPLPLQRYAGQSSEAVDTAPASVANTLTGFGRPLEPALRQDMEKRFGHDFSRVRVHSGKAAEQSVRDVNAHAYTAGHDIVFGPGRFAPGTHEGRRLIAHELAHVVQQSNTQGIHAGQGVGTRGLTPVHAEGRRIAREADRDREWQVACVKRLGGCANTRDAGLPNPEDIKRYNVECRNTTGYEEDVLPTDAECAAPLGEATKAELSYELSDAPISSDPKKRVSKWLQKQAPAIVVAESRFQVDRRAIAGAIAWEAIENVRGAWTPSSVGPGKVHIHTNKVYGENTVAKQVEDQGYVPKQSFEDRKKLLATPEGAITYIGAIMKAGADISKQVDGTDISGDPLVLTWFYNSKDIPGWREHLKARKAGTPFETAGNPMSLWVKGNLGFLEEAVGKPALTAPSVKKAPLQKHADPVDGGMSMLESEAEHMADAIGASPARAANAPTTRMVPGLSSDARGLPGSVRHVVASPGMPLELGVRYEMEQHFGLEFSHIRVHADTAAQRSAHEMNARAYAVGSDLVFATGKYSPPTLEGRRLIAHELTHTIQQGASEARGRQSAAFKNEGKRSRSSLMQCAPATSSAKPRAPTVDEIAREIGPALGGPYADYAAFASTMIPGSFLGHAITRGVRPEFLAKLQTAKTKIDAEFAKSGTPIPAGYGITSIGGFRPRAGPHGWGLAIDIDVAGNPFVMHEHGEALLDAQLAPVYHRIAEFMLNSPINAEQSIIPKVITQGKSMTGQTGQSRADRLGEYYDRLALESQAMRDYFALMNNPVADAISRFLAGSWQQKHPSSVPPAVDDVRRQMWEDYATLGGQIPKGGPPGLVGYKAPGAIGKQEDRPFAPNSAPPQDPAVGYLTIPREVVLGLGQTLSRWGAIDFGGESGDVQHFDDMGSLGGTIAAATARAKTKIAAAGGTP